MGSMERAIPPRTFLAALGLASALAAAPAPAEPFVPASDAVVLESLPEKARITERSCRVVREARNGKRPRGIERVRGEVRALAA